MALGPLGPGVKTGGLHQPTENGWMFTDHDLGIEWDVGWKGDGPSSFGHVD